MTAKPPRASTRRRALLLVVVILAVVAGGVGFAVLRGRRRAGLMEKAHAALQAGDRKTAEAHLRTLLASNPKNAAARARLIGILMEDERYDDAEALAREWTKVGPQPAAAWATLVEIAVRRQRFDEAEQIARDVAEAHPTLTHATIMRLRDLRGSFGDRLQSVDAALSLSALARMAVEKAELRLYAAETLFDLQAEAPEALRRSLGARARRCLAEATVALRASDATGKALRDMTARIQLFSESDPEAALGARTLEASLQEEPADHEDRAALAWHLIRRKEWDGAASHVRALRDGPLLLWLRSVRRWQQWGGDDRTMLALLDDAPARDHSMIALLRAGTLLRGDETQKQEGARLLRDLMTRSKSDPAVAVEAYRLLSREGEDPEAVRLLEEIADSSVDARTEALLATILSKTQAGQDTALRHVADLSGKIETLNEAALVLATLRQGDRRAVEEYLARPIEPGSEEGSRRLLMRATASATAALRDRKADDASLLETAATADLEALRDGSSVKQNLNVAWVLAVALERRRLAGELAARAIAREGLPEHVASHVMSLAGMQDDGGRGEIADGIVAVADQAGPAAFLRVLAGAVRKPGDRRLLLEDLERAEAEPSSRTPSLFLSVRVAVADGDAERAERIARRLVDSLPDSAEAREMLGDLLLRRKAYADVLALHPAPTGASPHPYRQRAVALWEEGRKDEALESARAGIRSAPRDATLHLLLARMHIDGGKKDEALSVLSVAPLVRDVAVLRADLLTERGEFFVAETLYAGVLSARPDDLGAWRGLSAVLAGQGKHVDLVGALSRRIERQKTPPDAALRAELIVLRGIALEALGRWEDALRDYEEALRTVPDHLVALNNAAWLIAHNRKDRLPDAIAYVERALVKAPKHPSVLDTAAALRSEQGEHEKALGFADQAVDLAPKPAYMLRRLRIYQSLGRADDARRQAEEIVKVAPNSPEARAAADALRGSR